MTRRKPAAAGAGDRITPEAAAVLAEWAGLEAADQAAGKDLAPLFEGARRRVERLYAVDVEPLEYDFLSIAPRGR